MNAKHYPAIVSVFLLLATGGCGNDPVNPDFVARVGDQYLFESTLQELIDSSPIVQDTVEMRRQIIDRWVSDAVLLEEARRRSLHRNQEVQQLLKENERSVLISALLSDLYEETESAPSDVELMTYYERNKESLLLREPFVRVFYLSSTTRDSAESARALLESAQQSTDPEASWLEITEKFSTDKSGSRILSDHFLPESRLFTHSSDLSRALAALRDGQITPVLKSDSLFHVIQLVERVPAGSIPRFEWVKEDLADRLSVQARKQMYAQQVQRLRNEALAREELEFR